MRDAARSRGRKHRLDPLNGLRVLRSAPFGLTIREWSARVGASDKTLRDAWIAPLFEAHGLVERASSRYRLTPLGRAVVAATENQARGEGNEEENGDADRESIEIAEITEVEEPETDSEWADIRIPEIPEQATGQDPVKAGRST